MKIDGRKIANKILRGLKIRTDKLIKKGISPCLSIILIGSDKSSQVYVREKFKAGQKLGITIKLHHLPVNITLNKLQLLVDSININDSVNGIIIQRPVPINVSSDFLNSIVLPAKDVDGFHPKSSFDPPVALSVMEVLRYIFEQSKDDRNFDLWLKNKRILVVGRGETAGKPIANYLQRLNFKIYIAHSQTTDLKQLSLATDIIIPCVGRPNIVRHDMISPGAILIGVGLHPEADRKLSADYDQSEIAAKAGFYTPVPGGVGPVNVAMLFKNVIKAAQMQSI